MIVLDASAAVAAVAAEPRNERLMARLAEDGDLNVPHLFTVEVLNALRGLVLGGQLTARRAGAARLDVANLRMTRHPHEPLGKRIWQLRDNLSAYDAAYVALAEVLGVHLVSCDRRIAAAPGHGAVVDVYEPGE